ncbi:Shugoshin C terminus, putative isoform 2 [Hibiscus syriacus]|uniref:Shugoshin C terminus, putative isoform 2 n=1 Tax=Hibiscus syriacus TaxID=106335 RepID=A0A6A3BD15_HIBSY|nr:SHUGOSHIN 2-like [Hibiscus syriacus]KAE8713887.1 Shugoshin C terminus, putative isoform 2 [Hibiscus syriacus]
MENRSLISNTSRKGLSDITNLQHQPQVLTQDEKLLWKPASFNSKDYIDKLQQENMTLLKVLADRNKVIELSAIELQKLRINLEKFQQQNLQLAQANSLMLSELNSGKDRLKALKHELGCKNAVLQAIKSEKKAKIVACPTSGNEQGTNKYGRAGESLKEEDRDYKPCSRSRCDKEVESLKEANGENKSCNTNRRQQSKSLCPSNIKPVEAKEGVENKSRVCLRKQSARFKPQESETTEDVFKVDNTNFLVPSRCDDEVHLSSLVSSDSSFKKEPDEGCMIPGNEAQELRRPFTGRPSRRAAEKVQSYKEMKVNVKMRREL